MEEYQENRTDYYIFEGGIDEISYEERPQNLENKVVVAEQE